MGFPNFNLEASREGSHVWKYKGYISSHDYQRADDQELAALAKKIKA